MKIHILICMVVFGLTACTPSRFLKHPRLDRFELNYPSKESKKQLATTGPKLLFEFAKNPKLSKHKIQLLEDYFIFCQKLGNLNTSLRVDDLVCGSIPRQGVGAYYQYGKIYIKPEVLTNYGQELPYTLYPHTVFHEMVHYASKAARYSTDNEIFRQEFEADLVATLISLKLHKLIGCVEKSSAGYPANGRMPYIGHIYFGNLLDLTEIVNRWKILLRTRSMKSFKGLFKSVYRKEAHPKSYLYALVEVAIIVYVSEYGVDDTHHLRKILEVKNNHFTLSTKELLEMLDKILSKRNLSECIKLYHEIWRQETGIIIKELLF